MRYSTSKRLAFSALAALLTGAAIIGCSSTTPTTSANRTAPTTQPLAFGFIPPPPQKSGAQLWSDNCARCHNMRPPEEYGPNQWAAIVMHMRMRADLTGEEARKVTLFLQAASGN
jgi:hypothetical protein